MTHNTQEETLDGIQKIEECTSKAESQKDFPHKEHNNPDIAFVKLSCLTIVKSISPYFSVFY